ncbi:hypothetical protein FRC08_011074 [Ceratobasidium sp. 394]|nr:hypothetical protein FRC08_011074 [Ceratobasidium sp. 394]
MWPFPVARLLLADNSISPSVAVLSPPAVSKKHQRIIVNEHEGTEEGDNEDKKRVMYRR